MNIYRNYSLTFLTAVVIMLSLNGCASYNYVKITKDIKEVYPGQLEGYLKTEALPDSKTPTSTSSTGFGSAGKRQGCIQFVPYNK